VAVAVRQQQEEAGVVPMQDVTQPVPAHQPAEADMVPAPPLAATAAEPAAEPGFGVALDYVTDCSDLLRADAVALILAVRAHSPSVYATVREASSPGGLPHAFREALYTQARGQFGEERALQLSVPERVVLDGFHGPVVQLRRAAPCQPVAASTGRVAAGPPPLVPSPALSCSSDGEGPQRPRRSQRRAQPGGGLAYWQGGTPAKRPPPPLPPGGIPDEKAAPPRGRRRAP
jgi:hypothetical protein